MERAEQIELIERLLALIDAKSTDMGPASSAQPAAAYRDPEQFERELARVFAASPLVVGHVSALADPGSFFTYEQAGLRVAVVRQSDGTLGAFVDACLHRGTRLLSEPRGKLRNSIVCPYHGWNYGLDGQLLHVPHAYGFPEVRCRERALTPVAVTVGHGLIWVQRDARPIDLDAWLGSELASELSAFGLADHVEVEANASEPGCNWKLLVDGGLETYHLRRTHPSTVYPLFLDNVALVDFFGRHVRIVFAKRSIAECRAVPAREWELLDHTNLLYFVFPNTFLLVQKDRVTRVGIHPLAVDRSRTVIATLLQRPPETEKEKRFMQANSALVDAALAEDWQMGESIQKSLAANAVERLTFGRFEHAIAHFHRTLSTHPADL